MQGLLTWPKNEGDKEKEGEENKDEGNNDEEKEEPLESDRPDFTDSRTTVGYQRFQIESGYTYTHAIAGDPTHNAHDLPELLVRYGVAERLELRVAWDEGMVFDRYTDRNSGHVITENGSTDLEFGFKYAISKQDKWRPQSAIIVSVSAPVGAPAQSSRQVDSSGQLPLQLGVHQEALAELQHGQSVDRRVGRPLLAVFSVRIRRV